MKLYIVHMTCSYMGTGFQCMLAFKDQDEALATHTRIQHLMQTEPHSIITFEHMEGARETVRIETIAKVGYTTGTTPPRGLAIPSNSPQFGGGFNG